MLASRLGVSGVSGCSGRGASSTTGQRNYVEDFKTCFDCPENPAVLRWFPQSFPVQRWVNILQYVGIKPKAHFGGDRRVLLDPVRGWISGNQRR